MLEKIDDALFAQAEKAESNMVQTLYFDAMRELRIIRKDIEEDFVSQFSAGFEQGIARQTRDDGGFKLNWDDDSGPGLIDKDDMEEDLAIANMVNKIRGNCGQSLFALDKRIGFLLADPDLERWENPLSPDAICNAFKQAAKRIETGLEIRLVIFKLFDQHVIGYLDTIYKEVNQRLVKMGVMPEIKATIRRTANPAAGAPATAGGTISGSGLSDLSGGHTPAGIPPSSVSGATGVSGEGYEVPAQPMINALTFLQQGNLPPLPSGADSGLLNVELTDLASGQVNVLHGIRKSELAGDLGKTSDMAIGMVAMLFDYILDDKNVPGAMRALIGRLQIPVLKVALLDQEFFSRKSHPARQLLNRLAATAVAWDEQLGTADPLYLKIESIVQTILDRFEDETSLFATLLDDLDSFLRRDEEQAKIRAERSAKVMEGQERLELAKTTTSEEIESRINNQQNLDFVRSFVTTHWKNLLFITCARQGKDSEAWKQAVATMDDLIWSVKPKQTAQERQRLVSMQPGLLQRLREGMQRLSIPATERDDFVAKLVRAHGRTTVNKADVTIQQIATTPTENPKEKKLQTTTHRASTGKTKPKNRQPISETEDRFTAMVDLLKTGSWMEFRGSDGKAKRAKLSWISSLTDTYLFTDRQGLKAGHYGRQELARLLRGARARILNDAPLMDRAVSTVLKEFQAN
jgi:hypothetical protein